MAMYEATDTNTSSVGKMLSALVSGYQEAKRKKMQDEMYKLQMEQQKAKMAATAKDDIEADQRREAMLKLFSQGQIANQAQQQNQTNAALQDVQGMPGIPFAPTPEMKAQLPNNDAANADAQRAFVEALSQAQGQMAAGQSKLNAFTPTTMAGLEGLGTIASGGNYKTPVEKNAETAAASREKIAADKLAVSEKQFKAKQENFKTANQLKYDIHTENNQTALKIGRMNAEAARGRTLDAKEVENTFRAADAVFDKSAKNVEMFRKLIEDARGDDYRPDYAAHMASLEAGLKDAVVARDEAAKNLREIPAVATEAKGKPGAGGAAPTAEQWIAEQKKKKRMFTTAAEAKAAYIAETGGK